MNKSEFYDRLRRTKSFNGRLTQSQVDGLEALMKEGRDLPLHHMANVMAQCFKETGGLLAPIKETVMSWHKDKNPSDAEVIRRLDRAFANGQLPWVKKPYWREGEFGRGLIQVTHSENRLKFGITNRDDLLRLDVAARVAIRGMVNGMFTGKRLAHYDFPSALDNPPDTNPRRIVNGKDGTDLEVAAIHREFAAALAAASWGAAPAPSALRRPSFGLPIGWLAKIFGGNK